MADDGAFAAKTLADWARLARSELKGKPLAALDRTTPEGITLKPLYAAADLEAIAAAGFPLAAAMPGFPPYLRGPRATMYANRPWTIRQYSGFSTAEESNRFLSREPRGRADGAVDRLRPRHPSRLRQRPPAGRGRRRQGRGRDRLGRGHEDPVRRHPARQNERVDDDERRGLAGLGRLHRRRRGAGRRAGQALRHDPERHPQGVHGPQHLYLPARAVDAHRRRHHRIHRPPHAEIQFDLDLRLSHGGSRGDLGAGAGLHPRRRARIRARRPVARPRDRRIRAAAVVLFRHRHEFLHGGRQAARRPAAVGAAAAAVLAKGPGEPRVAHALPDLGREPDRAGPAQQHRPHHDRGAGRGARRHAVAAHQFLRRGDGAADPGLDARRPQHPADPRRGDRHPACDRSAGRQLLPRKPDPFDRRGGDGADRRGRGAGRHDQGGRGRHAQIAHRGGRGAAPGGDRPRRGDDRRGQQIPLRRCRRNRPPRRRQQRGARRADGAARPGAP